MSDSNMKAQSPKHAPSKRKRSQTLSKPSAGGKKVKTSDATSSQRRYSRRHERLKIAPPKLVRYLVSDSALFLSCPKEERDILEGESHKRIYSSIAFNPFEELLCAITLARPISHRLGLRTIATLLNPPYSFSSAKAVIEAGSDRRTAAYQEAKTQHKQKQVENLAHLATSVLERFSASEDDHGVDLSRLRDEKTEFDHDRIVSQLTENIKGFGKSASDIFLRRMQWQWPEIYPFVDDKASSALQQFGLPTDAEELKRLVQDCCSGRNSISLPDIEAVDLPRRAFALVVERALGIDLEGNVDEALSNASKA